MKKLLTAIVVLGIIALAFGSVFAGSKTMIVRANVPGVWDLQWLNTTSDFGDLSTNNLGNANYNDLPWKVGTPLKFYIRTNRDYLVQFGSNLDYLMTAFDNLGGGQAPRVDTRYTPTNTSSTGNTNAIIETQYKVDVSMIWYDNGRRDPATGWHTGTPQNVPDYTDARTLSGQYVDDMGTGANIFEPVSGTLYGHHWTGGAQGYFTITPRIKPLGLGQQPGYYNGDFTMIVIPHQWDAAS